MNLLGSCMYAIQECDWGWRGISDTKLDLMMEMKHETCAE